MKVRSPLIDATFPFLFNLPRCSLDKPYTNPTPTDDLDCVDDLISYWCRQDNTYVVSKLLPRGNNLVS